MVQVHYLLHPALSPEIRWCHLGGVWMKVGEIPPHPGLVPELAQFSLAIQTLTDLVKEEGIWKVINSLQYWTKIIV